MIPAVGTGRPLRHHLQVFVCAALQRQLPAGRCLGWQVRLADGITAGVPAPCADCRVGRVVALQLGVQFLAPENRS